MIKAKWKKGFEGFYKADPQRVAEEILSIGESATPEQIVDKARDSKTALHSCFTWDNDIAAEKWRKHEAIDVVHFLVVDRQDEERKDEPEVRFFYKCETQEGYKPVERIFRNETEYSSMLKRAAMELEAFKRKYNVLSDLDEMQALIDAVNGLIERER